MTTNHPHDPEGLGAAPGEVTHPSTDPLSALPPETGAEARPSSTTATTSSTGNGSGAGERAKETAGTASQETKKVAGVAQEEAAKVASEAKDQVRGLLDDATGQLREQSATQKSRLTEVLRTFGDDLDGMAQQQEGSGPAGQLVQQVSQRARTLASHLEDREPADLLEDVRRFARRRPGTFLLGAAVAGVVAGRLARGAKEAGSDGSSRSVTGSQGTQAGLSPAPRTVGTVSPTPVAGVDPTFEQPFDEPGPGRDVLVDPLDPIDRTDPIDPIDPGRAGGPSGPAYGGPGDGGRA